MKKLTKNFFLSQIYKHKNKFLLLVGLVVFILFITKSDFERQAYVKDARVEESLKQGKLDYHFENISMYRYDKNGTLQSHLQAEQALHYRDSDFIQLTKLHYDFLQKSQWRLQADLGQLNEKTEQIKVIDNVEILFDTQNPNSLKINTSELDFDLKSQIATNNKLTKITNQNLDLIGLGLELNLAKETAELKRNIKGTYKLKF